MIIGLCYRLFFLLRHFDHLLVVALKLATVVFTSLRFQTLWPNWLNFFFFFDRIDENFFRFFLMTELTKFFFSVIKKNSICDRKKTGSFSTWAPEAMELAAFANILRWGLDREAERRKRESTVHRGNAHRRRPSIAKPNTDALLSNDRFAAVPVQSDAKQQQQGAAALRIVGVGLRWTRFVSVLQCKGPGPDPRRR